MAKHKFIKKKNLPSKMGVQIYIFIIFVKIVFFSFVAKVPTVKHSYILTYV